MKIMLSAGEVSGDLHGRRLAEALLQLDPSLQLFGLGGKEMEGAGVRLIRDFADYNVMGVWEVLKNLRRIMKLLSDLEEAMKVERPDLLVLIDYPDFNWRLAKKAKALGISVFSYIPPSAWAWRKGRAKACAAIADEFVAIFPHELPPYEKAGARISFVGNPLVDTVKPEIPLKKAPEFFGLKAGEVPILMLPGSRRQEIEFLLPEMLGAARLLKEKKPESRFFLPVAAPSLEGRIKELIEAAGVEVTLAYENRYALMGMGAAAMATSGTVVMEAALMGLPCVVLYRLAPLSAFIGRLVVHVDNISLPNILLGERFQPEFLQDEVQSENIAQAMLPLYPGEEHREAVCKKLQEACARLGEPGAACRVAEKVLACARRHSIE